MASQPLKLPPSAEQVLRARLAAVHTQSEAAASIYRSERNWRQWERGEREMDAALFELYTLKTRA